MRVVEGVAHIQSAVVKWERGKDFAEHDEELLQLRRLRNLDLNGDGYTDHRRASSFLLAEGFYNNLDQIEQYDSC